MNYFEQLAQNFAHQLIRPRRYNYSEQILQNFFDENPHLYSRFIKISNKRQQMLQTLLVKKNINNAPSRSCIVYAHGLGSNKLQVLSILKHLKQFPYDVCSFDFSGSGKSQGKFTSYGLREQDDLTAILRWLDQTQSYDEYILWGRSMGSVAIILSQGLILNPKVRSIILDSPFSSFEKVSLEIASKKSFIPELFLQPFLSYLKEYFQKKSQFNPFTVNVTETIKFIERKIMFIYSKNDSVVSHTHSLKLKANCKLSPQQIEIVEDHNMQRSKDTHLQAYNFIVRNGLRQNFPIKQIQTQNNICLDQTIIFDKVQCETNRGKSLCRNRGISLTSKQSFREKEKQNIPIQSNRGRNSTCGGVKNAKINLVITQSLVMNRKHSFIESNSHLKEARVKPSSIKLGRSNCEHRSFVSLGKFSPKSVAQKPSVMVSLNSIDTIDSNIQQLSKRMDQNLNTIIYTNTENQEFSKELIKKPKQNLQIKESLKKENSKQNHHQIKHSQKFSSFYKGQFLEDINLLSSINSIYLNRKKIKENFNKETPKTTNTLKQNHQASHQQGKQTPHVSYAKQKITVSSVKRPSIQLRRKNRFVF